MELLLRDVFPAFEVTPVQIVHNPRGAQGDNFSFVNETAYFVVPASRKLVASRRLSGEEISAASSNLRNWGGESRRLDAANCFYPIYVKDGQIVGFGEDVTHDANVHPAHNEASRGGCTAVWPIDGKNIERKWRYARTTVERIRHLLVVKELVSGEQKGEIEIQIAKDEAQQKTVWIAKHLDASTYGSQLISKFIPTRSFPYPKSLYAVQDCVDAVVRYRPDAVVVDFFAGSGTTVHAVMRLNKQDGGRRRCISVTNNEVSADEQKRLRSRGMRPGDLEWERWGICDYVTKPRIEAAITGMTPDGDPVKGDYKFTDEFPMADGFEENVEFFTLTYEAPLRVSSHREFERIAPLLWLRAGSGGRRIDDLRQGWDVAEAYGVLADLDQVDKFLAALDDHPDARLAFVVTDEDRLFEAVCRDLPAHVEPVRLYESYLRNFEIESGRAAR